MPVKPSDAEDEYFRKEEIRKLKDAAEESSRRMAEAERDRLKQLHWMRCPKCGMQLEEVDFRDVKVDSCFTCGGMFLDKGEIDKALAHDEPGWLGRAVRTLLGD
jgi:hypothetical protein